MPPVPRSSRDSKVTEALSRARERRSRLASEKKAKTAQVAAKQYQYQPPPPEYGSVAALRPSAPSAPRAPDSQQSDRLGEAERIFARASYNAANFEVRQCTVVN